MQLARLVSELVGRAAQVVVVGDLNHDLPALDAVLGALRGDEQRLEVTPLSLKAAEAAGGERLDHAIAVCEPGRGLAQGSGLVAERVAYVDDAACEFSDHPLLRIDVEWRR